MLYFRNVKTVQPTISAVHTSKRFISVIFDSYSFNKNDCKDFDLIMLHK